MVFLMKFYSALEHADYGHINVLPREYIVHLETDHCPMDVSAIDDINAHYCRGKGVDERLSKFSSRMDEEQIRLAVDGVITSNPDKFQHYLSEIYKSDTFTVEAITQWTERSPPPTNRRTRAHAYSSRLNKGEWRRCSASRGRGGRPVARVSA